MIDCVRAFVYLCIIRLVVLKSGLGLEYRLKSIFVGLGLGLGKLFAAGTYCN